LARPDAIRAYLAAFRIFRLATSKMAPCAGCRVPASVRDWIGGGPDHPDNRLNSARAGRFHCALNTANHMAQTHRPVRVGRTATVSVENGWVPTVIVSMRPVGTTLSMHINAVALISAPHLLPGRTRREAVQGHLGRVALPGGRPGTARPSGGPPGAAQGHFPKRLLLWMSITPP
jgi:hypothetical protein